MAGTSAAIAHSMEVLWWLPWGGHGREALAAQLVVVEGGWGGLLRWSRSCSGGGDVVEVVVGDGACGGNRRGGVGGGSSGGSIGAVVVGDGGRDSMSCGGGVVSTGGNVCVLVDLNLPYLFHICLGGMVLVVVVDGGGC